MALNPFERLLNDVISTYIVLVPYKDAGGPCSGQRLLEIEIKRERHGQSDG